MLGDMWCKAWAAAAVVLGACAGDDGPSGPQPIEFCAGTAGFTAFRDGAGPWQTPVADARGINVLQVTDDYEYVTVREQSGYVSWYSTRSTLRETRALIGAAELHCATPADQRVMVSGELAQAGEVWMNSYGTLNSDPGPFTLSVGRGVHDLFATTGNLVEAGAKIVVRRDQSIENDTMVALVDIATQGSDFVAVPVATSGVASGAAVSTSVYLLDSRNDDYAFVSDRAGTSAGVVPPALLGPSTEQWIAVSAASQYADLRYQGSAPAVQLLPPLTGITFSRGADGITATWQSLAVPDYSYAQLIVSGSTTTASTFQYAFATPGWIAKHGVTALALDTTIPGLDLARWKLDTTQPFNADFALAVDHGDTYASTSTSTDETMTPRTQPVPASPRVVMQRAALGR